MPHTGNSGMDVTEAGVSILHVAVVTLGLVVSAIGVILKWLHGEIRSGDAALWKAVDEHRRDETEHERRIADKLADLVTKQDLRAEFDRQLSLLRPHAERADD